MLDEPNETVTVTLGAPTNATVSATEGAGTADGTITDDDATPTVTLALTPGGHRRIRRHQPESTVIAEPERRDQPGPHPHRRRGGGVPGPRG